MGFLIRPANGNANWWHTGSLDGTVTYVLRTWHGIVCTAFFNSRPPDSKALFAEIDRGMWKAIRAVPAWPE
jgi:N-acyl-D-amino-acid deacylase